MAAAGTTVGVATAATIIVETTATATTGINSF